MNAQREILVPSTQEELMQRVDALAHRSLKEIAQDLNLEIPSNLKRMKGWIGCLLEQLLGADGGSQAVMDFSGLGIELKTIPVNSQGLPLETTYVCTVPLLAPPETRFENSWLYRKLCHVLWIPIEGTRQIPLAERKILQGFLWQPSDAEKAQLRADFEELTDLLWTGRFAELSARLGTVLQIRPKAAHSRILASTYDDEGQCVQSGPKGFYLRKEFTARILQSQGLGTYF